MTTCLTAHACRLYRSPAIPVCLPRNRNPALAEMLACGPVVLLAGLADVDVDGGRLGLRVWLAGCRRLGRCRLRLGCHSRGRSPRVRVPQPAEARPRQPLRWPKALHLPGAEGIRDGRAAQAQSDQDLRSRPRVLPRFRSGTSRPEGCGRTPAGGRSGRSLPVALGVSTFFARSHDDMLNAQSFGNLCNS
jgi:hypothetical protein